MTESFKILREYNLNKMNEIIEFMRIAKLDDLIQRKHTLLYNIYSLDDFNDIEKSEKMELIELFTDANNKVIKMLDERITFLNNEKIDDISNIKDLNENEIILSILKKMENLSNYINIYKGHLQNKFFITLIDKLLEGLSKLFIWYNNNLNKL